MLEKLLEEIKRLQEAKKLLDRVWAEVDVYRGEFRNGKDKEMTDDLMRDMRRFYDFDDSE